MAKSKKLPSGRWNCSVYSHTDEFGKRHYASFTADTKAEASRLGAEFMANKQHQNKPQNFTVEQAYDKYILSKSNILASDTLKEYKAYKKYYQSIKDIKIGSLNAMHFQNLANELSKDKSPKTVKNIISPLKSAVSKYTDRNFSITLKPNNVIERYIPTDNDVKNLIQKANPRLKLAIILGSQGLRRGEIASLKYGDILRDLDAIYIHSDMILGENGWEYKDRPKTQKSNRRIILPKDVINMMGTGSDDEYILGILPSTITTDFINLRNKLGLKCRFHDLRHYSASILHALGLPDAFIMEHNGYSSDVVMKSVYRHVLSDKAITYTSIANKYFTDNIMQDKMQDDDTQSQ